jgi:hypothetical protein
MGWRDSFFGGEEEIVLVLHAGDEPAIRQDGT